MKTTIDLTKSQKPEAITKVFNGRETKPAALSARILQKISSPAEKYKAMGNGI